MNPILMTVILLGTLGMFAWSSVRRYRLAMVAQPDPSFSWDSASLAKRVENLLTYSFGQRKMPQNEKYAAAGFAHMGIFGAFLVLGVNSAMLWFRGYDTDFDFFGLLSENFILGQLYSFAKELAALAAIAGGLYFVYLRVGPKPPRMSFGLEGLIILGIIITMMIADFIYVGGGLALEAKAHGETPGLLWYAPVGSLLAIPLSGLPNTALYALWHAGFWWHAAWVLLFLNLLPFSKHFHVLTNFPNVFFTPLGPKGKLPDVEDIEGKIEREEPIGINRAEHLTRKHVLDLYTCTECGRCSDNCPAYTTGKKLSPKHLTLALRDHFYDLEPHFIGTGGINAPKSKAEEDHAKDASHLHVHGAPPEGAYHRKLEPVDLIPDIIAPEVIWACTTCRACEEQCPVNISYVDKIVGMRRAEMLVKNEFPHDLQKAFRGMETNGNPWNLPALDRGNWADGLEAEGFEVRFLADHPGAEVVYWVGCAAEYDDRAKKTARAVAKLLSHAGVDFAVMGSDATCTGDPARRAGNEYLFQMLAQQNVETLNELGCAVSTEAGKKSKTIITACPHCFNTLKNEYPSFGGKYDVVHHSDFLNGLLKAGKLQPSKPVQARVVYHDSCYLGRYNEVYDSPRELLQAIPGVTLVEAEYWNKRQGLCCGAGGAQMWKEDEPGKERVNKKRTLQLLDTKADKIASGCPFCMTMISDGISGEDRSDVENLDLAEMLDLSVVYKAAPSAEAAE